MIKRNLYSSTALLLAAMLMFTGCGTGSSTVTPTTSPSNQDVILDDSFTGSENTNTDTPASQLPNNDTAPNLPDGTTPPDMPEGFTPPDMPEGFDPNMNPFQYPGQNASDNGTSESIVLPETVDTNITLDNKDTEVKDAFSLISSSDVTSITLSGTTATVVGEGVKVKDGEIKIKEAGTYILSGNFNGEVIVNAKDADVNLILNGAVITSDDSAAVYVKKANKVVITLQEGTTNTLTDAAEYVYSQDEETGELETEPSACLYAKSDLTINGNGKLVINGNYADGIKSKDTLMLISGTYVINAQKHGIVGKDYLLVKDGTYTITAGSDGIKSTNDNTNDEGVTEKGIVVIENGNINITSGDDGITAVTLLSVEGGNLTVKTGKGAANASAKHDSFDRGFGGWSSKNASGSATDTETESPKGLSCDNQIQISGGIINIDAEDDAVHSNSSFIMTGGDVTLAAGDDAIHSDNSLVVNDGKINITKSYEGLEAMAIVINGGEHIITAEDDGVNAAAESTTGSMFGGFRGFASGSSASLVITGGSLYVNAKGDGLDSNGSMEINGGYIIVEGPTDSANAALDTDGEMLINGGTILAVGALGMFESPSVNSAQNSISVACSTTSGNTIELKDSTGKVLVSFKVSKTINNAVVTVSSPDIAQGSTYTVSTGSTNTNVTVSSTVTNEGVNSMGGFGGGFGGNQPGGNGGRQPGGFGGRR